MFSVDARPIYDMVIVIVGIANVVALAGWALWLNRRRRHDP
jgi:hypothetical protein